MIIPKVEMMKKRGKRTYVENEFHDLFESFGMFDLQIKFNFG